MPKIPTDVDYGARQSLAVNRMDRPGTGGIVLADAMERAVTNFDQVLKERQRKEDALNYALARNEIQQADLEARASLEGDQDWAKYDEKYSDRFNSSRDSILKKYTLSQNDMAIMSSESDLIGSRGRIAVGGASRKVEVDQGVAAYQAGSLRSRQSLIGAVDGASRNAIVLGELDAINAMEEKGYFTAEQAQRERETMTQDFALGSIEAMPKPEQIAILRASLAKRRGGGNGKTDSGVPALTAEDIRAGKGTGSIADFLHADTAAKMLKQAEGSSKENDNRVASQNVLDKAVELYPEDHAARMKYIKENSEGTVREMAETNAEQYNNSQTAIVAAEQTAIVNDAAKAIEESTPTDPFGVTNIPPDDWAMLTYSQQETLRQIADMKQRDQYHADQTVLISPDEGGMSMETWNALPNYAPDGTASKSTVDLGSPEWRSILSEPDFRALTSIQQNLKAAENKPVADNGLTVTQLVNDAMTSTNFMGAGINDKEKKEVTARLRMELEEKITTMQNSFTPPRALVPEEKRKILNEMLQERAFLPDWGFDDEYNVATMTTEQIGKAYLPLEAAKLTKLPTALDEKLGGQGLTIYDYLVQKARDSGVQGKISERDLERAYFALENGMSQDEVISRLRGE